MADKKISQLPEGTPAQGADQLVVNRGGTNYRVTAASVASPGGSDTQVQFNDGGSSFGGDAGLTYNKTTNVLTNTNGQVVLTGGTVTASTPLISATQTWNASGTTFNGVFLNVTNTASAAASLLMNLQVGGTSRFTVDTNGGLTITGPASSGATLAKFAPSTGTAYVQINNNGQIIVNSDGNSPTRHFSVRKDQIEVAYIDFAGNVVGNAQGAFSQLNIDGSAVLLDSEGNHVLAQRNGANAQTFRLYGTFTSATSFERLNLTTSSSNFVVGTEKGSTGGSARSLLFQTDATTRLTLGTDNTATFTGNRVNFDSSGYNYVIESANFWGFGLYVNGNLRGRLQFGAGTGHDANLTAGGTTFGSLTLTATGTRLRNGTSPHPLLIHGTYTSDTSFERLALTTSSSNFVIATEKGSAGGLARDLIFQTDSTERMRLGAAGGVTITGGTVTTSAQVLSATQTWNAAAITTTGASGDGTTATLTFAAQATAIPVGSTITVSTIQPTGYRGTYVVTASSTTSVSYANTTTAAQTVAGTVQEVVSSVKMNITDTASAASSSLLDLQVGGASRFKVLKSGAIANGLTLTDVVGQAGSVTLQIGSGSSLHTNNLSSVNNVVWGNGFGILGGGNGTPVTVASNANVLLVFVPSTNIIEQRNTGAQTYRLYGTYTSATSFERLNLTTNSSNFVIGTEKGSTGGAARDLIFQTDATERLRIGAAGGITVTGGTATTSTPVLSATQTWNDGSVTFQGVVLNITNTASAAASRAVDVQAAGSSVFSVAATGQARSAVGFSMVDASAGVSSDLLWVSTSAAVGFAGTSTTGNGPFLRYDGVDGALAQRADTAAQTFRLYGTYSSSTIFERLALTTDAGNFVIATQKGSAGGNARDLVLQTDSTTRLTISATGAATFTGNVQAPRVLMAGDTSGVVTVKAAGTTDSWTLTLPANDGDAGQVLATDGSGTLSWTAAGGGTKTLGVFTPLDNQPPATAFATLDTRNSIAVLDFDAAADESAVFVGVIPEGAVLTNGIKVRLNWMATSATSGNCRWRVAFEKMTTDEDTDSFDSDTEANGAANGTSGIPTITDLTATAIDSLVAGDFFRIRVTRVGSDATNDTMTGDVELIAVEVQAV